jgi:hypothetical protein
MRFPALIVLTEIAFAASVVCGASNHSSGNPFRSSSGQGNSSSSGASSATADENCLPIAEAKKHIGKTYCVSGTVVHVEEDNRGVTFLDFCTDYRSCPFTVVVFPGDLRKVGDVRQLQGRAITIQGRIEEYDERAEIILSRPQQLGKSAAILTALPKDYDVERQGHFSAGTFRATKPKRTRTKTQGAPIPIEDPEEP